MKWLCGRGKKKKKKWRQTEHISVVQESRSHRSEQNGCTKSTWGLRPDALLLILQGGRRAQSSVGTKKSWLVLKTETQARCSRRERSLGSRPPTPRADLSLLCPRTSNLPTSLTCSCLLGKTTKLKAFLYSSSTLQHSCLPPAPPRHPILVFISKTCFKGRLWSSPHVCAQLLRCVRLCATPWTLARQAPLSIGFLRQEYWSGLPCPPPGDLPNPGIKPKSPALQAGSLPLSHQGSPLKSSSYINWHKLSSRYQETVREKQMASWQGQIAAIGQTVLCFAYIKDCTFSL